jgi:hypothetical protein
MKNIILTSLAVFALFSAALLTGCNDDPCKIISCANSGTCVDGTCKCPLGYEGIHCETIMRDKFIKDGGIWNVNEDGTLSPITQYAASMEAGDKVNQVKIYNVQNNIPFNKTPVIGTVKNDTITIPLQTITSVDGTAKIEGWGFIKGTNPLDQHYYQHATVKFYYVITNSIGQVNKYGYPDEGVPSIWSK